MIPCKDRGNHLEFGVGKRFRKEVLSEKCPRCESIDFDKGKSYYYCSECKKKWERIYKYITLIHCGNNYRVYAKTAIRSVADGIIVFAGMTSQFVNCCKSIYIIICKHNNNAGNFFYAVYGHVNSYLRKGRKVRKGDIIGEIVEYKYINDEGKKQNFDCMFFSIWDHNSYPLTPFDFRKEIIYYKEPISYLKNYT